MREDEGTAVDFVDVTFAIIAGGRATRLGGVKKPRIRIGGTTIFERQAALARGFAGLLVNANERPDWPLPSGTIVVADAIRDCGAPGGVHAVLAAARTEWVLVVGGDMPFVSRAAVDRLMREKDDAVDGVCFEVGGRLEPLLGLYRSAMAAPWARLLGRQPSFRELLSGFRARFLPEGELRRVDPDLRSVVSLNEPADLVRWGAQAPD